jgi:hypothetical protein
MTIQKLIIWLNESIAKAIRGCCHRLLEYLAEKTGISLRKDIVTKGVYKVSKHTGKK